jgi:hypothetical protein
MSTSEPHPQAGVVGFQLSALRALKPQPGSLPGGGRFVMALFFAIMAECGADHCRPFAEVARMIVPMGFRSWVASNRQTNNTGNQQICAPRKSLRVE